MKKLIYLSLLLLLSCDVDSGETPSVVNFNEANIEESFLLNEEWIVTSILSNKAIDYNRNGMKSVKIREQLSNCFLDDILIFEKGLDNSNKLILKKGENICMPNTNENYTYSLDSVNKKLSVDVLISDLETSLVLNKIKFFNSNFEDKGKKITGEITFIFEGEEIGALYSLDSK